VIFYMKKDILKASREFSEAILNDKKFSPAYSNLGIIYYNKDQFKEALDNFKKAATYDTMEPRYLFNCGWTLRAMGQKEKSYSFFRRASDLKAPSAYSVTWKIIKAYDNKDYAKVKEHLKELSHVDKEFDKGHYFQGLLLTHEKKYKEASELYKKMLEENPFDRDVKEQVKKLRPLLKNAEAEEKKKEGEVKEKEVKEKKVKEKDEEVTESEDKKTGEKKEQKGEDKDKDSKKSGKLEDLPDKVDNDKKK